MGRGAEVRAPGLGHNQGPSMERGRVWRTYQWKKARAAAMPKTMPLMVVKMHVARARQLGLDYATYAAVRKASGRDIMGLLFSSNALRIVRAEAPAMPLDRSEAVGAVKGARKLALVHRPLHASAIKAGNPVLDDVAVAPKFTDSWSEMKAHIGGFVNGADLLGDQVLIIGDTALERDWAAGARAAGYLEAQQYFGAR